MDINDEKNKIKDLADFKTVNQPYVIDIDIAKNDNYWEVGMKTKYNGKDVEILECIAHKDYKKVISPVSEAGVYLEMQRRALCTLVIRDL